MPPFALRAALVLGLLAAVLTGGCKDETPAPPAEPSGSDADPERLCEEHGVLEAVCAKCNPKLAGIFKKKGDWCEEHGFAESFCPTCHPEKGGRPGVDVSTDEAPADGTKVTFNRKDVAAIAGIETVLAEPGTSNIELTVPARIAYDATKLAQLNARAPGVVSSLSVDIGSMVKRGDPLLTIESPEVGAQRARLAATVASVELAQKELVRKSELAANGLIPEKEVAFAENDLAKAKSDQAAIVASLSVMGAAGGGGGYGLTAPIDGVVTARTATIGTMVDSEQILLEIVDTSSVWAELDVPETKLTVVQKGQSVTLRFSALADQTREGVIDYIAPAIDRNTRTARVRVPLENDDKHLRAEMYGEATVKVTGSQGVLVPAAAIQRAKTVQIAFVELGDDQFEVRRVTLGTRQGDNIEVLKGVAAGERVVTTGSFLLKTETLKDSIGAGCCEVD